MGRFALSQGSVGEQPLGITGKTGGHRAEVITPLARGVMGGLLYLRA